MGQPLLRLKFGVVQDPGRIDHQPQRRKSCQVPDQAGETVIIGEVQSDRSHRGSGRWRVTVMGGQQREARGPDGKPGEQRRADAPAANDEGRALPGRERLPCCW